MPRPCARAVASAAADEDGQTLAHKRSVTSTAIRQAVAELEKRAPKRFIAVGLGRGKRGTLVVASLDFPALSARNDSLRSVAGLDY